MVEAGIQIYPGDFCSGNLLAKNRDRRISVKKPVKEWFFHAKKRYDMEISFAADIVPQGISYRGPWPAATSINIAGKVKDVKSRGNYCNNG